MHNFVIELAEEVVLVSSIFDSTRVFCSEYIVEKKPSIHIEISIEDIKREHELSDKQRQREGLSFHRYSDEYIETLALYRKIVDVFFEKEIFLFHGSVIAVDEKAYLFTAPSGTGKSTHVSLWQKKFGSRAVLVNDDKPLLRTIDGITYVYGTPWMGKHHRGINAKYPLISICEVNRGLENSIKKVSYQEMFSVLLSQSQRPKDQINMKKFFILLDTLGKTVNFYKLYCTISEEAVEVAYKSMKNKN